MVVKSYRDLEVWQLAMRLAEETYAVTAHFPSREQFGLAAQLRRAAVSIPSNIAEGSPRPTRGYIYHLRIAAGSDAELQTQLELAIRLRLVPTPEADKALTLAGQVGRMLHGLISSLEARLASRDP